MTERDNSERDPTQPSDELMRDYHQALVGIDGLTERIIRRTIINQRAESDEELELIRREVPNQVNTYLAIDAKAAQLGFARSKLRMAVLHSLELICSAYNLDDQLQECLERINDTDYSPRLEYTDAVVETEAELARIRKNKHYESSAPKGLDALDRD